jgi:ABC-type polysaccharide/polyol phosphate transport system ATPase subunit
MKKLFLSALVLVYGCSSPSEQESPSEDLKTTSIHLQSGDRLTLIDLNGSIPDTLLVTSDRVSEVKMVDRGYFELKVQNDTEKPIELYMSRDNKITYMFNSGAPTSGCLIQLFNR